MRKVIIYDIIGAYCGMHYYDIAFADILRKRNVDVEVYSNFCEGKNGYPRISNIFDCGKIKGVFRLMVSYLSFLILVLSNKTSKIIYLTYGEIFELPFLFIASFSRHTYIDIHEVCALKYGDTSIVARIFRWLYGHLIRRVIYHSDRTYTILQNSNLEKIYVPHFKYVFPKRYDEAFISKDVRECFKEEGVTKFLFFGNISVVKGIDTILQVFTDLCKDTDKFELVIAGKNVENIDFSTVSDKRIKIICRHIDDDEMVYLYSNTDFILLPYKKSSQSGIFAMAAYFQKPMILSDIPYFKKMIEEFPSFGIIAPIANFKTKVENIIKNQPHNFYCKEDCECFEMKNEMDEFVNKLIK